MTGVLLLCSSCLAALASSVELFPSHLGPKRFLLNPQVLDCYRASVRGEAFSGFQLLWWLCWTPGFKHPRWPIYGSARGTIAFSLGSVFSLGCPQGTWTKEGHPIRWFMLFLPFATNRNWSSSFFSGGLFGSLGWFFFDFFFFLYFFVCVHSLDVFIAIHLKGYRMLLTVFQCCLTSFGKSTVFPERTFFFQCSGCNGIRFSWLPWEQQHLAHFYCWAYSFYTHPHCALLSLLTN